MSHCISLYYIKDNINKIKIKYYYSLGIFGTLTLKKIVALTRNIENLWFAAMTDGMIIVK
jgi:hypothetical protein